MLQVTSWAAKNLVAGSPGCYQVFGIQRIHGDGGPNVDDVIVSDLDNIDGCGRCYRRADHHANDGCHEQETCCSTARHPSHHLKSETLEEWVNITLTKIWETRNHYCGWSTIPL